MASPIVLCDTAGMSNERWLECRAHGPKGDIEYTVGGSDVATIFGVSPWTTPLELWMIKKGRMKPAVKANALQLEMISAEHTDTHDELRARFTSWLDTTIYRARLKYLAKEANRIPCTSLDAVSEECLWSFDDYQFAFSREHQFDFEEERLAKAFANLPVQRQQILTMLFVEERKPEEIARLLHCSVQHVYDQRYQTIRKLRKVLTEEDHK